MSQNEENVKQLWATLVAQSWKDENLRQRLLEEPAAVLEENGVSVPGGATVKTFEDDGSTIILPVALEPADTALSDEALASVAGGANVIGGLAWTWKSFGAFSSLKIHPPDEEALKLNTEPIP